MLSLPKYFLPAKKSFFYFLIIFSSILQTILINDIVL